MRNILLVPILLCFSSHFSAMAENFTGRYTGVMHLREFVDNLGTSSDLILPTLKANMFVTDTGSKGRIKVGRLVNGKCNEVKRQFVCTARIPRLDIPGVANCKASYLYGFERVSRRYLVKYSYLVSCTGYTGYSYYTGYLNRRS